MRSLDEILQTSPRQPAFSNGTSWEIWAYNWCRDCVNDDNDDCPLIAAAMLSVTPREWTRTGLQDYECTEFEPRGELQ